MKNILGVMSVLCVLGAAVVTTLMVVWLFVHKGVPVGILGTLLFPVTAVVFPFYLWRESGQFWPLLFYMFVLLGMLAVLAGRFADEGNMRKELENEGKDRRDQAQP